MAPKQVYLQMKSQMCIRDMQRIKKASAIIQANGHAELLVEERFCRVLLG
jgi:hypothetical protein